MMMEYDLGTLILSSHKDEPIIGVIIGSEFNHANVMVYLIKWPTNVISRMSIFDVDFYARKWKKFQKEL